MGKKKKHERKRVKRGRLPSRHFLLSSRCHHSGASSFLQQKLFCKASLWFLNLTAGDQSLQDFGRILGVSQVARAGGGAPAHRGLGRVASRLSVTKKVISLPEGTGTLQSPACTPRGVQNLCWPRPGLPGSAFAAQWSQCESLRSDRSYITTGATEPQSATTVLGVTWFSPLVWGRTGSR